MPSIISLMPKTTFMGLRDKDQVTLMQVLISRIEEDNIYSLPGYDGKTTAFDCYDKFESGEWPVLIPDDEIEVALPNPRSSKPSAPAGPSALPNIKGNKPKSSSKSKMDLMMEILQGLKADVEKIKQEKEDPGPNMMEAMMRFFNTPNQHEGKEGNLEDNKQEEEPKEEERKKKKRKEKEIKEEEI